MNILLVDDDGDGRSSLGTFLNELGHNVIEAEDGQQALSIYSANDIHLILSDLRMPGMGGLELLRKLKSAEDFNADVVFFTGHGGVDTAIQALRLGAYDYLQKPLNVEELAMLIERVAEHQALMRENQILSIHFQDAVDAVARSTKEELKLYKDALIQAVGIGTVSCQSEAMQKIVRKARSLHEERGIPVLIQGETGTGKELVARLIHYGEQAVSQPFVAINCATLASGVFESELFGYEAGSFTGGIPQGQKGKFDLACGGTLFLDEISELTPALQAKLLRVIQEKEYYRVGGLKKLKTDIRLICATNLEVERLVAAGTFRADLYYRLNVATIEIPPLRDRREDILPLAELFLNEFTVGRGKNGKKLQPDAAMMLLEYKWPGNVRELRNVMEWLAFSSDSDIIESGQLSLGQRTSGLAPASHTEPDAAQRAGNVQNRLLLDPENFELPNSEFSLEKHMSQIVIKALEKHKGNKTATARYLGVSRRVLDGRIRQISHLSD